MTSTLTHLPARGFGPMRNKAPPGKSEGKDAPSLTWVGGSSRMRGAKRASISLAIAGVCLDFRSFAMSDIRAGVICILSCVGAAI